LVRANEEVEEAQELEQRAGEVEVTMGKSIKTAVDHHGEYDDGPSPHGFVLASMTAVKPGDNDKVAGEYCPIPPSLPQFGPPPFPTPEPSNKMALAHL